MKDLKKILFENMYYSFALAHDREITNPVWKRDYVKEAVVLWGVILEAGLTEEYRGYADKKGEET